MLRLLLALCLFSSLHLASRPAAAQSGPRCFAEVPWCIEAPFLSFWQRNGGVATFGLPLGPARMQATDHGMRLVQPFERQRFEWHPELPAPYQISLGRLGAELLARSGVDWQQFPRTPNDPYRYPSSTTDCHRFAATGFSVCAPFHAAWRSGGVELDGHPGLSDAERLALWGLPISPPLVHTNSSGQRVVAQWFERARFEWVAQPNGGGTVLLGRLGAEQHLEAQRPQGTLIRGHQLWELDNGQLRPWQAHGINYNPPWAPWGLWEQWNPQRVNADLAQIAALGANVVRVALPWRNFRASAAQSDRYRTHFASFVDLARAHNLRIIPILFDEFCKYGKPDGIACWDNWLWDGETDELARALPAHYRNNPTIALWELSNEPGWVEPNETIWQAHRANRLAWLVQAARVVREAAPYQPLTVGVSMVTEAAAVIDAGVSETITLHYYPEIHLNRRSLLDELGDLAHYQLPILISEIGASASPHLGGNEATQAAFACQMLAVTRNTGAGMLWWHLQGWDGITWESELGLLRPDGSLRPAAHVWAKHTPCP